MKEDDERLFELVDRLSENKIIATTVYRVANDWWKDGFTAGRKFQMEQEKANNFLGYFVYFFFGIMSTILTQILWTMWG